MDEHEIVAAVARGILAGELEHTTIRTLQTGLLCVDCRQRTVEVRAIIPDSGVPAEPSVAFVCVAGCGLVDPRSYRIQTTEGS